MNYLSVVVALVDYQRPYPLFNKKSVFDGASIGNNHLYVNKNDRKSFA